MCNWLFKSLDFEFRFVFGNPDKDVIFYGHLSFRTKCAFHKIVDISISNTYLLYGHKNHAKPYIIYLYISIYFNILNHIVNQS